MRRPFLILLPALCGALVAASFTSGAKSLTNVYSFQTRDTLPLKDTAQKEVDLRTFTKVEVEASFPGGEEGWRAFLGSLLNPDVPVKRKAPVGRYNVVIQFIVDKDGSVTGIKALTAHGFGMEEEVMRVIRQSPRWTPAEQGGRKVKAYRKQPITFSVSDK